MTKPHGHAHRLAAFFWRRRELYRDPSLLAPCSLSHSGVQAAAVAVRERSDSGAGEFLRQRQPSARIVRFANADHYVNRTDESDGLVQRCP